MGETAEFVTSQKEDFLTLAQVEALVEWAVQQTGSTALGMYLGARLNLSAHGIAGYAGLCAANLGEALRVAQPDVPPPPSMPPARTGPSASPNRS